MKEVQNQRLPKLADTLPKPEIYYDPEAGGKCFFFRNDREHFIAASEGSLKRMLRETGICTEMLRGEMTSEMDRFLNHAQRCNDVDYAGPLAGYQTGVYLIEGRRVLVTHGPKFIEPDGFGDWPTLRTVLTNLLSDEQTPYFYGWLKVAVTALRRGERRPGQCLVVAGPVGSGKSLLQNLVTTLLGGRSAKPYQYMTGATQFNSELFQAEHLMIEDEASDLDYSRRRKLGANLKAFVVNQTQRCHPKNRRALTLEPFWRVSLSCNDDAEDLLVMPPLGDSLQDKLTLLRTFKMPMPMPTETTDQRQAFQDVMAAETPRFLHFLLNEFQIPGHLRCPRYGITHFHHPELVRMMSTLSAESKLLELIDTEIFADGKCPLLPNGLPGWEGKSSKMEADLSNPGSKVAYEARKLMIYNNACGQYLGRLQKLHPDRITSRLRDGYNIWTIRPPRDEASAADS